MMQEWPESPASETSDEEFLAELFDEISKRLEAGEEVDPRAYVRRYPERAEQVEKLIPTLELLVAADSTLTTDRSSREPGLPEDELEGPAGRTLGDFRVVGEIGRGGMGVVYEAQQISLGRRVALKVLPFASVFDQRQIRRFRHEAQAAAQLHHQHIVPVFAVGCERGVHYYAMQYIEGLTLVEVINELRQRRSEVTSGAARGGGTGSPLPGERGSRSKPSRGITSTSGFGDASSGSREFMRAVARLGIQAAEALDYAHEVGVVHRDIKPANLLLDAGGDVWVTDFGLAQFETGSNLTLTGDLLGTLRYMSPEQALGKRVVVDRRTDIYSLGVTLYELLTFEPAVRGRNREEILRRVTFEEPRPPRKLARAIPRELETIVLKAMAKNPLERYATATELADDLRCFVDERPIRARRPTVTERLWKWALRHKGVVGVAALALVLGLVGSTATAFYVGELSEERQQEILQLYLANGGRLLEDGDRLGALVWFAEALKVDAGNEEVHRTRIAAVLRESPRLVGFLEHGGEGGYGDIAHWSPDGRYVVTTGSDSWVYLWNVVTEERRALEHRPKTVRCAAFSPDGSRIMTESADGTVWFWDTTTGRTVLGPLEGPAAATSPDPGAYNRDGTLFATANRFTVDIWDARSGAHVFSREYVPEEDQPGFQARMSPDDRYVAVCGPWQEQQRVGMQVWDLATGERVHAVTEIVRTVQWTGDGYLYASGEETAWMLDPARFDACVAAPLDSGEDEPPRHRCVVRTFEGGGSACFSANGNVLVTTWPTLQLWEAETGERIAGMDESPNTAALSADGERLLTGSSDGMVRLWRTRDGLPVSPPLFHGGSVRHVAFSPEGQRFLGYTDDGTTRIWELSAPEESQTYTHVPEGDSSRAELDFAPDGRHIAVAGWNGTVDVLDAETGRLVTKIEHEGGQVHLARFHPGSQWLLTANHLTLRFWDAMTGTAMSPPIAGGAWTAEFSRDGQYAVRFWGPESETVGARVHEVESGVPAGPILPHETRGSVGSAEFDGDGRRVLVACGRIATVWSFPGQKVLARFVHPSKASMCTARFGPDGSAFRSSVLTAATDWRARLWNLESPEKPAAEMRHAGAVLTAVFSPDGHLVATGSADLTARVWDPHTGEPVTPPLRHGSPVTVVRFSPDARYLATGGRDSFFWTVPDRHAQVWDVESGQPVTPRLLHEATVRSLAFRPFPPGHAGSGRLILATGADDGRTRLFELGRDQRDAENIRLMAQIVSGRALDEKRNLLPLGKQEFRRVWDSLRSRYPSSY